jgi:hypothetical protein
VQFLKIYYLPFDVGQIKSGGIDVVGVMVGVMVSVVVGVVVGVIVGVLVVVVVTGPADNTKYAS